MPKLDDFYLANLPAINITKRDFPSVPLRFHKKKHKIDFEAH